MDNFIIIVSLSVVFIYFYLIIRFSFGLRKLHVSQEFDFTTKFSIIVPFRDEEKNLERLFLSLRELNYPKSNYEIIFVDDQSSDTSVSMVNDFILKISNASIIYSIGGKKKAISAGVQSSHFEIIACTDADCQIPQNWLSSSAKYFQDSTIQLLLGSVFFIETKSLLNRMFCLEFASLIASTAGSIGIGNPVMGNGANIMFKKSSYLLLDDALSNSNFLSGDDAFLLVGIKKMFGKNSIAFNYNELSAVSTMAPNSIIDFFKQRIRWASKSHKLNDFFTTFLALLVILSNLFVLLVFVGLLSSFPQQYFLWILVGLKFFADYVLLRAYLTKYHKQSLLQYFLPVQILYPFYIFVVLVLGKLINVEWKNRKLKL